MISAARKLYASFTFNLMPDLLHSFCSPCDPRCHITVAELRRLGFYLPETADDQAYIPRVLIGPDERESFEDGSHTIGLRVLERFSASRLPQSWRVPASN